MVSFCFNICLWISDKIKVCKPVSDTEEAFVWVLYFVLWASRVDSHLERICIVSREANLHTRLSRSFSFLSKEQLPGRALVILISLTLHFYIPPTFKSHSTLLSSLIITLFSQKVLRQVHYFIFSLFLGQIDTCGRTGAADRFHQRAMPEENCQCPFRGSVSWVPTRGHR